ncbi:hypothetical protein B0T26DRAFT_8897 [Lasiosphaeria miniovina]|uniref:Uncharacterized protein n=1 Tax=Lasiosphaeria miniovina TaxID=1954250 RepID=A0AA40BFG4_9PEZI|nr:uncharacterized protein B0T26DRAFT_8897 [Lasiosphaeria miniovina]KAK0733260.1 hypothetical protein B0T26DRAFT_8897 [Lasiosphaeria miniovina]
MRLPSPQHFVAFSTITTIPKGHTNLLGGDILWQIVQCLTTYLYVTAPRPLFFRRLCFYHVWWRPCPRLIFIARWHGTIATIIFCFFCLGQRLIHVNQSRGTGF